MAEPRTDSGACGVVIGSACLCTSFHSPNELTERRMTLFNGGVER